jgi:hypothetical protein
MPDNRINPRPEVKGGSAAPSPTQVVARPVNMGLAPAADNSDLTGLIQGLKSFNPALGDFQDIGLLEAKEAGYQQRERDKETAKAARATGEAQAQQSTMEVPMDLQAAPDAGFEGTFKTIQRDAYIKGIAARHLASTRSTLLTEYNEKKDLPDFNLDSFLQTSRQEHMQGLPTDMAGPVGEGLTNFETALRGDYEKVRLARLDIQREQNISSALTAHLNVGTDSEELLTNYRANVLPTILGQGKTEAEAGQYLLRRLAVISDQTGGKPDLFDAMMNVKGPDGKAVVDSDQKLLPMVQAAKAHAQAQLDKTLTDGALEGNVITRAALDQRLMSNPESITLDQLMAETGKYGLFQTDDQVSSYWRQVLQARASKVTDNSLYDMARNGTLMMADLSDQKKVMKTITGGVVQGLGKAIASGDTSGVAVLADALINAHQTAGTNAVSEPVQNLFKFIGKAKAGDAPPPAFLAGIEVYRRMVNNPALRDEYFDEDSRMVMDQYIQSKEAGATPEASYAGAYEATSPEGKRRAEAFKQTPEYKEKLSSVSKAIVGSSFVPRWIGGNGRPDNQGEMLGWSQEYASNLLKRHPGMTEAQALAETTRIAEKSFVMDETSHTAVRVPDGVAPEAAQKAISAYTKKLSADMKMGQREEGWGLIMQPDNINQGTYRVFTAFNGVQQSLVGPVNIKDVVAQHRKNTLWLPEDAAVLKQADMALSSGAPMAPGVQQAIAKARILKVQPELVKRLDDAEMASARSILGSRLRSDYSPDTSALYRNDRPVKYDPKQTAASAQHLLDSSNGGSTGLAASLITLGEGVMLQSYDDPASGAGKNIGMGYNLNANRDNAPADLKAAGVPPERIQGIINGTEKLSPEQAERLMVVSVGRYERDAQRQVNGFQPNMWEKLQPQQRAVLTDIAYQTGNVGQFKKALTALVSGDEAGFKEHSKVFFTNRQGERVEDVRRNALRDSMLAGSAFWQSVLTKQGAMPSALDAVALNTHQ